MTLLSATPLVGVFSTGTSAVLTGLSAAAVTACLRFAALAAVYLWSSDPDRRRRAWRLLTLRRVTASAHRPPVPCASLTMTPTASNAPSPDRSRDGSSPHVTTHSSQFIARG